jgi:Protein of unknown function (DUF3363)
VRRLEAIRRVTKGVEREPDRTWIIAPHHLERAAAYERRQAKEAPVAVQTLSVIPIERQLGADGATWLDRELVADAPVPLRDSGFGREVRDALARRRQWLIEQELARAEQDQTIYRANMLAILRRRELTRVAGQLSDELGLDYADMRPGQRNRGCLPPVDRTGERSVRRDREESRVHAGALTTGAGAQPRQTGLWYRKGRDDFVDAGAAAERAVDIVG